MPTAAAVRAGTTQEALAYLDRFRAGASGEVRDAMAAAPLAAIDGAKATDWLPLEHDRDAVRATVATLGRDDSLAAWRSFAGHYLESPLMRTAVDTAKRVFGLSPATLVRFTPRLWPLLYRGVCFPRAVTFDGQRAEIVFDALHPDVAGEPGYAVMFEALLGAYLDICEVEGEVQLEWNDAGKVARAELSW